MNNLSQAESHLWQWIQDNIEKIPHLSINELADETNVSNSTVTRTLKKCGYDGYIDFRHRTAKETRQQSEYGFSKEVNEAIRKNEMEVVRTINALSAEDIEQVVKWIDEKSHIIFFANGISTAVAQEMALKFQLFGKEVYSYDDKSYMEYFAKRLGIEHLVFVISLSGETPELTPAVKIARESEAKVVVLTATVPSTLSKLADICLPVYRSSLQLLDYDLDVASRIPLSVVGRILIDTYAIHQNSGRIRK